MSIEPAKQLPSFTSGGTSTEDVISDISYVIRSLFQSTPAIEAVGVTTGENLFMGFLAAFKAAKRFQKGRVTQDPDALFEAGVDGARGVAQGIGGGCFLGYRATFIACLATGVDTSAKATTALGRATFLLGTIGGVFFTGLYAFTGIWGGFRLARDWSFRTTLKTHTSASAQFQHLVESSGLRTKDVKKQSQFSNACSEGALKEIEKGLQLGIEERLLSDDPVVRGQAIAQVEKIVSQIGQENKQRLITDVLLLFMGGLGIVVSALSFVAVPPVLITVLSVLIALEMLCVDGIFLKGGWEGDEIGRYDKLFVVIVTLVLVLAFCVGVGVTLAFGLPLAPIIVGGIVTALGVAVGVVSFLKLQEKEKRWEENHPKNLNEVLNHQHPSQQFKKLPKEVRKEFTRGVIAEEGELEFLGLVPWVLFQRDVKTQALLIRAAKKATKLCWARKETLRVDKAMRMQALLDHTLSGEEGSSRVYQAFRAVQSDPVLADLLRKATWLVFTREEQLCS